MEVHVSSMSPQASHSILFRAMILLLAATALWHTAYQGRVQAQEQMLLDTVSARTAYAEQLAAESQARKAEALQWAMEHQAPVRWENGRQSCELMALWDDRPVYYITANLNAATSLQTDRVRDTLPWDLDGEGVTVGLWDSAGARKNHQELMGPDGESRVFVRDSFVTSAHSTHVAGTIAAAGIVPAARGMAPAARIESYDWNDDTAQIGARAAGSPGQHNAIYLSNHSYGIVVGWAYHATDTLSGYIGWHWWGSWAGPDSVETWFGRYSDIASAWDRTAYASPYYLAFTSAGNDRCDVPEDGETVYRSAGGGGWRTITYSPDTCPPGDGQAKGGYDTVSFFAVAKNVVTVGAVHDAVSQGVQSLGHAAMTDFSCWGPTDDGRIKPDIVANGVGVYSATDYSDNSYAAYDGTSMSSPSAVGSAALLMQHYGRLFPGQYMRASTLKGLILHTADDLGRPGPDYEYGWGLMNTRAAVEMITKHSEDTRGDTLVEDIVDNNQRSRSYGLYCDAGESIHVTLCWTEPPAPPTVLSDDDTRLLIHDLDLRLVGPDGQTTYYPYALDPSNPTAPAQTGNNDRDNVEQIHLSQVTEPGVYEVSVSYRGTLRDGEQRYSLVSSEPLFHGRPPIAEDVTAFTSPDRPVTITLPGHDVDASESPEALTYVLVSLPAHGILETPDGSALFGPGALPQHGNKVVYRADAGFIGDDSFAFCVDDGGSRPSGGSSNAATATIRVRDLTTVEYQVCSSSDDAYGGEGYQLSIGRYLWVGQDSTGVRFRDVALPPGSTILKAHLKLYAGGNARVRGAVHAEATGDALDFAKGKPEISERLLTDTAVQWDWQGDEPRGQWYSSPDIAAVVQEVVNRSDWASGNAMALLYIGHEIGGRSIYFCAWDDDPALAPKLEIVYSLALGTDAKQPPGPPGRKPPTAEEVALYASPGQPLVIRLAGEDDGLPMAMNYTIASLPRHGTLSDHGVPITAAIGLPASIDRVVYVPDAGFAGDDSFTYCAHDGGKPPLGGTSNTATVTIRVRDLVTRHYQVIAAADDACGAAGNPMVFSESLRVGALGSAMRFRNIDIPPGSEIAGARLWICLDADGIERPVEGIVQAEAVGNARDFTGSGRRIFALPTTIAGVPWAWQAGEAGPRGSYCPSPDIGSVIQEVVDRPDWQRGNALAILYLPVSNAGQDLTFFACDDVHGDRAARLEITFVPGLDAEPVPLPSEGNPPQADATQAQTPQNTPVTITLRATDDGLPEYPGQLDYQIASLGQHGTLAHLDGTQITAPTTLRNFSNQVVYTPQADFAGTDTFTFSAGDGGTSPTGGFSEVATVTITVTREHAPRPLGYWSFDENAGDIAGDSIGNRHGVIHGAQWIPGPVASALEFDGVDDYVSLPGNGDSWLSSNDLTLALWVRFLSVNQYCDEMLLDLDYAKCVEKGSKWSFVNEAGYCLTRFSINQKIAFLMGITDGAGEDLETTASFADDAWVHIVAVRRGDTQELYVNGALDNSRTCSSAPIHFGGSGSNGEVSIGRYTTSNAYWDRAKACNLRGAMDDVMIFDQALVPQEVQRLYQTGSGLWSQQQ